MQATSILLQERYEVLRLIAQGGMGAVYEGRDWRLGGSPVALKQALFSTQQMQQAFEREANLLARLSHPCLPKVRDLFTEGSAQYIVMEYVPGYDLEEMLQQRRQALEVPLVLKWAEQILDTLEYLHGAQPPVIHRDIKPNNLKLTPQGHVMLLDFGLSKGEEAGVSVHGYTSAYAPIEQMRNSGTDARSDIYALGATLFRLLTGAIPENALKRLEAIALNQYDPQRLAHELNPTAPPLVSHVLHRAMMLNREARFHSAREMRLSLRAALRSEPPVSSSVLETTVPTPLPEGNFNSGAQDSGRRSSGPHNSGAYNSGAHNSGAHHSGSQRSGAPPSPAPGLPPEPPRAAPPRPVFDPPVQQTSRAQQPPVQPYEGTTPLPYEGTTPLPPPPSFTQRVPPPTVNRQSASPPAYQQPSAPPAQPARPAPPPSFPPAAFNSQPTYNSPPTYNPNSVPGRQRSGPAAPPVPRPVAPAAPQPLTTPESNATPAWLKYVLLGVLLLTLGIGAGLLLQLGGAKPEPETADARATAGQTEQLPATPPPEALPSQFTNRAGMEFLLLPVGRFTMGGSEADATPLHKVTLARPFYLSKYETTQRQWQALLSNNPSQFKGPELPVENVSFPEVEHFIAALNQLQDGYHYRLPSEAEWEYAARAGSNESAPPEPNNLAAHAWYNANAKAPQPVGGKQPNGFGLYDMLGNVAEWCADSWHANYQGAPADGAVWEAASNPESLRVIRGESWNSAARLCHPAYRNYDKAQNRSSVLGFRLVAVKLAADAAAPSAP